MTKLHSLTKPLIALAITAVVVGGGAFAWSHYHKSNDVQQPNSTDQSAEQPSQTENSAAPENSVDLPAKQPDPKSSETNPDTASESPLAVEITNASFSGNTNTAIVRAVVDGAKDGTCTATFKKSGRKTVTQSASVQVVTSYFSCGKLDVARSRFSASGTWTVTVTLTSGGASVTSASETINIL